ncbi:Apd1p [Sugiyamaella lignohabitans]|uniref:Altered inheritance of mitochondria protein 32 n=1 Tax=Sugiyamaella lignohabitans TaxID=796027 RepID=A0A167CNM2_9ASCO|nr:Apd1p [Sugiyamaella lignohabitans]ANB11929.1 Apd1p [Sugiyamaella lignohabitans]
MPDMSLFPKQDKPLPPSPIHAKQLVICSGTSDWPSKIDGDTTSLAGIIGASKRTLFRPQYPVMVVNCDLPATTSSKSPNSASAYLFPDNLYFDDIPLDKVDKFFENYVRPSSTEAVQSEDIPNPRPASPLILICGHASRDVRCGVIAPLLVEEFTKVLTEKGLYFDAETNPTGIRVSVSSHVGGHAFAGNVIYHPSDSSSAALPASVWYGKVFPHHVQGIVEETILNGRVVQPLLRGYGPRKW